MGKEFLGAHVRVYVELADGHEVRLLVGQDRAGARDSLRAGTNTELVWYPNAAFVLPTR